MITDAIDVNEVICSVNQLFVPVVDGMTEPSTPPVICAIRKDVMLATAKQPQPIYSIAKSVITGNKNRVRRQIQ